MSNFLNQFSSKFKTNSLRVNSFWATIISAPLLLAGGFFAWGTNTPPSIPAITLANEPLYAAATTDKPTMALALSVEFPTIGAQYVPTGNNLDATYTNTNEYLGYYNSDSCYSYIDQPSETIPSGKIQTDYKRFNRVGDATNRRCDDAFSGNFLNWASSSAIDMLRLALSGGDRYIDTPSLTILQRAVIPNGDPVCMWNTSNFPAKQLSRDSGNYLGAVPVAMRTAAGSNNIFVANTLNKIYFGTANQGSCTNPYGYMLGSAQPEKGSETRYNNDPPSDLTLCSAENGVCNLTGKQEVWFGAGRRWVYAPATVRINCNNSAFTDPASGTLKSCYVRNYTGSWQPTSSGLNTDGYFFSRVQVCNSNNGVLQDTRDYNFCKQYPNGNYKPTGVIQKYSDQLRLAAFGYLMEQTASYNAGRYGGVLRAPMKYVGTKTYDSNGQDNTPNGGNPKAEWNANTGVFLENPENDTLQISGVINYLNRFGRTGPVAGRYKKYDPVGELYYQSLRYLQGLPPTPDAVSDLTTDMMDGFPVYTEWNEDPYGGNRSDTADYSCLKSNIVVVGDVNTHDGNWRNIPTTDNSAANVPNFRDWHATVRNFEANRSTTYIDGQGTSRTTGNPNGANNSSPSRTDRSQIMGYAYWAHTHDIRGNNWTNGAGSKKRPGLRVKTYIFDVNEGGGSNDDAARRSGNQFFMGAKYGGFESDPSNSGSKPYNTWGNPFKAQDGTNNNNVWQKATTPGEASTYYLQSNARGVLSAFDEIFGRAVTTARSIAGISTQSSSISTSAGTVIYSAQFDTTNWSGDVVAEPVTVNASNELNLGASIWSASSRLTNMASPATSRNIFVGSAGSTANPAATEFLWANISAQLKTDLDKVSPTSSGDNRAEQRLNYIRGDRTLEGNPFRARSSLLGDIINSNVIYSGAPTKAYTGTGYAAFRSSFDSRTPAVFAGANDGMLHAFNANNGDELFAYIPSWLGYKLAAFTDNSFTSSHQNYVDAPLVVGEAQVASSGSASDWKTVLVGGTGGGGAGVFALDVSNPSAFSANKVIWEFTKDDDADLGQVIGQPKILKLKISGSSSTPVYRWFAVVGSGVNNYIAEKANAPFSTTGDPAIFLLALDKPVGTAWTLGDNYFKISLPADSTLKPTIATGVANFTPLYGINGEVTDIYAGDLHGNLWKLSFGNIAPSNWNINTLSFFNKGTAAAPRPYPMYIAKTGAATPAVQPITAAPALFAGPLVSGVETYYVAIATGKYLEISDKISTNQNSFYVIYDNGSSTGDSTNGASAISGRGRLAAATFNTSTQTVTVPSFTWGRAASNADTAKRSGWYFDLPNTGERMVSNIADLGASMGAVNSIVPGSSGATAGSCVSNQGTGYAYSFDVTNGSTKYRQSNVGILGPAAYFTNESETTVTPSDSTGRRQRTYIKRGLNFGQKGSSDSGQSVQTTQIIGRLSWRQINNYQDMKNANP